MSEWIYESPDKGKTYTRRLPHSVEDADKEINVEGDVWMSLQDLRDLGKQHAHENKLRRLHPQLMELWESYQTMLKLVNEGPSDDYL